jgi:short-subunit dehydrogenase
MRELCVIGQSSKLTEELIKVGVNVISFGRLSVPSIDVLTPRSEWLNKIPLDHTHYCINIGLLIGKSILEIDREDVVSSLLVNLVSVIEIAEYVLNKNPKARILIVGSESGAKGSYDTTYFLSKAAIRQYVLERRVAVEQQLLLVSPSTISDGAMTLRRLDHDRLEMYRKAHPKKRFLKMSELAHLIKSVFMENHPFLCNEEISLNGGKFARLG